MPNFPDWFWYLIGATVFVMAYLYLMAGKYKPVSAVGRTVTVPNTQDLANYNGSANILSQLLNMTQNEHQQLGASPQSSGN